MRHLFNFFAVALVGICVASCSKGDFYMDGLVYPEADYEASMPEPGYEEAGDRFDEIKDNDFIKTSDQNVSTFSIDADGAAYGYMRKLLSKGMLPVASSVRIEEYLNYFTFNYADPTGDHTVAINSEVGPCPWNEGHFLVRLGLKGKSMDLSQTPPANFVFMVDVSGSMDSADKLGLLKTCLATLVDNLRPDDRVSIITYASKVEKLIESTPASEANKIKEAIAKLNARGSTAGGAAMKMAYEEALANFIEGGNNRVIMGTDGDFNVGVTSTDALLEMVQDYADKGIYFTVCGFGSGNLNDSMMETISNKGNGTYQYIDSELEMVKVFVHENSKFYSVANDTKVQITFDAEKVDSYRLIGYENRVMANEDFENDDKDAGEIGAGQTITALYEIIPAEGFESGQQVAVFDVRYKKALGQESILLTDDVMSVSSDGTEISFAAGVAAYGMILRNSKYRGSADYDMAASLVEQGLAFDPHGYRAELLELISTAKFLAL